MIVVMVDGACLLGVTQQVRDAFEVKVKKAVDKIKSMVIRESSAEQLRIVKLTVQKELDNIVLEDRVGFNQLLR
jgi:hypothetical protein